MTAERRLDALQLNLCDLDTGLLVVEQLLQQRLCLVGDLLALVRHRRLDGGAADDVAQRPFGRDPHRKLRIVHLEQELARIADLPEYSAVRFHDVLVPGQHLPTAARLAVRRRDRRRSAKLDLIDLRHFGQEHRFDRVRQVDVQAGFGGRHPSTEAQHDALLIRFNPVEGSGEPGEEDEARQGDNPASVEAGQAEEVADAGAKGAPYIQRDCERIVLARLPIHGSLLTRFDSDRPRLSPVQPPNSLRASGARARAAFRSRS